MSQSKSWVLYKLLPVALQPLATPVTHASRHEDLCKVCHCAPHVTTFTLHGKIGKGSVFPDCIEKINLSGVQYLM